MGSNPALPVCTFAGVRVARERSAPVEYVVVRAAPAVRPSQRVDPDYQYDTPVPTTAQALAASDARSNDALGGSIGDLAPAVLGR